MNVHPNDIRPEDEFQYFLRPTHKQSIAIQTCTDSPRHSLPIEDREFERIWRITEILRKDR
jgi:hypothetical protein